MDIKKKILAGVGAVALGSAVFAGNASAFTGTVNDGSAFTSPAHATVTDTLVVTTTPLAFGSFAAIGDGSTVGHIVLSPTGTFTPTAGGTGKIIDAGLGDHAASTISVTGFHAVTLFATYGNVHDLIGGSGKIFQVRYLEDNLTSAGSCFVSTNNVGGVADVCAATGAAQVPPTTRSSIGSGTTDGSTGVLTFNIGARIDTVAATLVYPSEAYTGTFDLTLSY